MYNINGINLFSSFGFLASGNRESVNSFEIPNNPAEVFSHTWDNGVVEWDLNTVPGAAPRVFKLTGCIIANSEADYITKKIALEKLVKERKLTIYISEIGATVNAKLKGFSDWKRLTGIKGKNKIATQVSMEFNELLGLSFQTYNTYSGASNAIPVTAADVLALTATAFGTELIVNTGTTNRFINLVIQGDKGIISVTDLDNTMFPALDYRLRNSVTVNNVNMRVFTLELGSPYSTPHRHKFILSQL